MFVGVCVGFGDTFGLGFTGRPGHAWLGLGPLALVWARQTGFEVFLLGRRLGAVKRERDMKRMDIAEFRRLGYLQEVNRQFLHPLGLALEVMVEEDGSMRLSGVWDYRDDPEGMIFDEAEMGDEELALAREIELDRQRRMVCRRAALGYYVQPIAGVSIGPIGLLPERDALEILEGAHRLAHGGEHRLNDCPSAEWQGLRNGLLSGNWAG